jgi:cell division septum initiation protein DivIVA
MESFRRSFFGYERGQVDTRVNELKSELDGATREIEGLRTENARLSAELASVHASANEMARQEAAVKEALVSAHRQSEEVLAEARRESETLLQVSREAGMRLQDDLKGRISDLNWQIERLSLQKQKFASEFKEMLERQLQELTVPSEPQLFPQEEAPAPIVIEEIVVEATTPSETTT